MLSPLCTTSHIVLEDILLSLHSHAIDNEHSALVPWTYNLFDCRQLLPPTSRLVASMSGLANNCSITTPYALYAHGTLERPLFVLHVNQQDKPSGFLPRYGRYEVFGSAFSTHLDRVIVITSHLSLPALPHNTTPSKKEEHSLRCSWPMNSPMKPPHRLILSVPRVLDAFCKT